MSRRSKLKARERVVDADLFAALERRRERLLALAPVFLAAAKRVELVDGMLNKSKPSGMVVRMVAIALAEAINEGDL